MEDIVPEPTVNAQYDFKYIPADHFQRVVKTVQAKHHRTEQAHLWKSFFNAPAAPSPSHIDFAVIDKVPARTVRHPVPLPSPFTDRDIDRIVDETLGEIVESGDCPSQQKPTISFSLISPNRRVTSFRPASDVDAMCQTATNNQAKKPNKKKKLHTNRNQSTQPIVQRRTEDYMRCQPTTLTPRAQASAMRPSSQHSVKAEAERRNNQLHDMIEQLQLQELAVAKQLAANATPTQSTSSFRPKSATARTAVSTGLNNANASQLAVHLTKVTTYQERLCAVMTMLSDRLGDPADNDDAVAAAGDDRFDLRRRQKRFAEFLVRFNRNYLYQIGRTLDEIKAFNVVNDVCGESWQSSNQRGSSMAHQQHQSPTPPAVHGKVCALFGRLLEAAQTFGGNVLTDDAGALGKFLEFLAVVDDAVQVCAERRIFAENDALMERLLMRTGTLCDVIRERVVGRRATSRPTATGAEVTKRRGPSNGVSLMGHNQPIRPAYGMYGTSMCSPYAVKNVAPVKRRGIPGGGACRGRKVLNQSGKGRATDEQERLGSAEMPMLTETINDSIELPTIATEMPKSSQQLRRVRDIEDVETIVQHVSADAEDEEAMAPATASTTRLTEVEHKQLLMMDALQSITQQKVAEILTPLMAQLGAQQNPESLHRIVSALYAGCDGSKKAPSAMTTTTTTTDTTALDAGCPNTDNSSDVGVARASRAADAQRQNNSRQTEALLLTAVLGTINANATTRQSLTTSTTATTADVMSGNDGVGGGFDTPMMMNVSLDPETKQVATVSGAGGKGPTETNIRFCKNVHHTYIVKPQSSSSVEGIRTVTPVAVKPPTRPTDRLAGEAAQLHGSAEYRQRFLRSVVRKPLYLNKNFESEPWQLIGRIADETVRLAMEAVEADIDMGESCIVRSFIQGETSDGYKL